MCINPTSSLISKSTNGSIRSRFQGLAHYLEHMLFMGSSKYPDENEYDSFISKSGGGSNAFTECEYTLYHFDVLPQHLEKVCTHLIFKPAHLVSLVTACELLSCVSLCCVISGLVCIKSLHLARCQTNPETGRLMGASFSCSLP